MGFIYGKVEVRRQNHEQISKISKNPRHPTKKPLINIMFSKNDAVLLKVVYILTCIKPNKTISTNVFFKTASNVNTYSF